MTRHGCQRCDWEPTADQGHAHTQLAEHADTARHPVCCVCGLSLPREEPQTCTACLTRTRRNLAQVVTTYALLPDTLGHIPAKPADTGKPSTAETPLQGGDALSLLAPGSEGAQWRGPHKTSDLTTRRTPWRPERRIRNAIPDSDGNTLRPTTADEGNDNWPTDAPSVAFELSRWEDAWRSRRGEPPADTTPTVSRCAGYLERRMGWAADHHPAFPHFATELRNLLRRLEDTTSTSDRPQTGAPCFDCGADLKRAYGEENYSCPRCRRVYLAAEYWLAIRAQLISEAGTG